VSHGGEGTPRKAKQKGQLRKKINGKRQKKGRSRLTPDGGPSQTGERRGISMEGGGRKKEETRGRKEFTQKFNAPQMI